MDAFVEFQSFDEAMKATERHQQLVKTDNASRLGERNVTMVLSSQAGLMKDLFPVARGIFWNGAKPEIMPYNEREPWENFRGFIAPEEMVMLVKHVEVPHRVSAVNSPVI